MKHHEIVDAVAAAWREIGQPGITPDMFFVVQVDSDMEAALEMPAIIGIPVVRGNLHGADDDVTLAGGSNVPASLIYRFEKAMRGRIA